LEESIPFEIEKAAKYLWLTKLLGGSVSEEQFAAAKLLRPNLKVEARVVKDVKYYVRIGSKYYELKLDASQDAVLVREQGDIEFKKLVSLEDIKYM